MTEYCRLCAELKDPCEIVTSIADVEQSMEQKLMACCQWTTENAEQRLPHNVCAICLDKLDKCWLFSQSVQLAQQKLIEIFENDTEADIETKPLATEMVQIVYDFPDYSNNLSSPQTNHKSSSHRRNKKKVKKIKRSNPLQSNENEENDELDDMKYKCTICGRCFKKGWNLKEHLQRHSDERPYQCWLCHKTFTTNRSLRVHCKNQPENKCEICLRVFCTGTELNAHKQSPCEPPPIESSNSMVQCNDMDIKVESNEQNQNNYSSPVAAMQLGSPNGPFPVRKKTLGPFGCEICGRLFMKNSNLTKHRTIHTDEKPYECWLCHKMFRMRENLKRHLLIHTICSKIRLDIDKAKKRAKQIEMYGDSEPVIQFKHKCEECGRFFARRLTLRQHWTTHSNARPHECVLCHKTFKLKKTLHSHMKVHQDHRKPAAPNESNWVCELCGQAFTVKSSLTDHLQSKHSDERKYKCSCGLGFKTSRLLKLHGRTHTDLQYDCNQCEKSFRSTQSLKRHLEYHTGTIKKPFQCDVCTKGFRLNVNLVEHRRIHTGEKPHSCEYCTSNFRTGSSYYAHMRKIHGVSVSARNREEQARVTAMSSSMSLENEGQVLNQID